jgi:cyclic pyranopterin phosphate synthase
MRFIEYMDVGGATDWAMEQVVTRAEILQRLGRHYGGIEPIETADWAPADRYSLPDGTVFGIIASTTAPFCRTCDRGRLTADGSWLLCLYGESGIDLREPLRSGRSDAEIAASVEEAWRARQDRGAELRAESLHRGALYRLESLRADPHREMHTRGG